MKKDPNLLDDSCSRNNLVRLICVQLSQLGDRTNCTAIVDSSTPVARKFLSITKLHLIFLCCTRFSTSDGTPKNCDLQLTAFHRAKSLDVFLLTDYLCPTNIVILKFFKLVSATYYIFPHIEKINCCWTLKAKKARRKCRECLSHTLEKQKKTLSRTVHF